MHDPSSTFLLGTTLVFFGARGEFDLVKRLLGISLTSQSAPSRNHSGCERNHTFMFYLLYSLRLISNPLLPIPHLRTSAQLPSQNLYTRSVTVK
jgi:hypothetical protein